jgi:hypothetical protein
MLVFSGATASQEPQLADQTHGQEDGSEAYRGARHCGIVGKEIRSASLRLHVRLPGALPLKTVVDLDPATIACKVLVEPPKQPRPTGCDGKADGTSAARAESRYRMRDD